MKNLFLNVFVIILILLTSCIQKDEIEILPMTPVVVDTIIKPTTPIEGEYQSQLNLLVLPGCPRTLLVENMVDSLGNQCTIPILIEVFDSTLMQWLPLIILQNNVEAQTNVQWNQLMRINFIWCDGPPTTYATFSIMEWCNNEWQVEFQALAFPLNATGVNIIEKNLLDNQGHKVCDMCPD